MLGLKIATLLFASGVGIAAHAIADPAFFNPNKPPTKEYLDKRNAWLKRNTIIADGDYYSFQGQKKNNKGDFPAAIDDFSRAIPLNPRDVYTFWGRAYARDHTGDLAGAIEDYTSAAALKPKDPYSYRNRGHDKMLTDDMDGATADFDRAMALDRKDFWTWYYRAELRHVMRDWPGATADYRCACDLDKRNQDYWRLEYWLIRTCLDEKADADKEFSADLAEMAVGRGEDAEVALQFSAQHVIDDLVHDLRAEEAADHFGWFAAFAGIDSPASSKLTQERLGWHPTQTTLLTDLERGSYFKAN